MSDDAPERPSAEPHAAAEYWWSLAAVFGMLLIWSFGRVPVPGVNEPHYLSKAKHFCNPDWCAGDLFLESSNPHQVFYITVGPLTRFLTLEQTALLGRILGLMVVAVGWQRLARAVVGRPLGGVVALPFFALLQSLGNWSGEWLVGGIEAKVIAYGLLFYAIGAWIEAKAIPAGIAAGLSVGFHPLVGGWGVIAGIGATALQRFVPRGGQPDGEGGWRRPPRSRLFWGGAFALAFALPGIIPALAAVSGSSAELAKQANYLQLAGRLAHHLDPMVFPKESHRYFGMETVLWLLLTVIVPARRGATLWWRWFVVSTLAIAAVGILLAAGPRPIKLMPGWEWRIGLLKFYPFRLADLIVPVGVALSLSSWLARFADRRWGRTALVGVVAAMALGLGVALPGSDRRPSRMSPERLARWIDVLTWVRGNTSEDALLFGLDERWAVRWYAHRPEYVNYKDCPQDPRHLLEWNRRLWEIARWNREAYVFADGAFSASELAQLRSRTGIDYLITTRRIHVSAPEIYGNDQFAVYSLEDAAASR